MTTQPSDPKRLLGRLCPNLGLVDDRETALSYPSEHNCCYHANPINSVSTIKQNQYCLSKKYSECPIYSSEIITKLPEGWGEKNIRWPKPKPWVLLILATILVGIAILLSSLLGLFGKQPQPTPNYTNTFIGFEKITGAPTTMSVVPTETLTPAPTTTEIVLRPTDIIPHLLETPFSKNPQLIVHRIKEGEGLILIAEKYQTSVEAIKAINYAIRDTLLLNQIIVIPLNTTDVGNLPPFSAYQEQVGRVTIDELADRMKIDKISFRAVNDLPEGYLVSPGEWLLIPHY